MMTKTIKYLSDKVLTKAAFLVAITILFSCSDETGEEQQIIINPAPIAAFTETVDIVDYNTYMFTDRSSNATTYSWDFGDSSGSDEKQPTHTFPGVGSYNVVLTVSNDVATTDVVEKTIMVVNPNAPIVNFSFSESETDWKKIEFFNNSQRATSYSWDFGDGSSISTDFEPTHTYSGEENVQDYIVTLTATNDVSGDFTIQEKIVSVVNPDPEEDPTRKVIVFNPTFDDFTKNTGDNADGWDCTPNSTVEDNDGNTIPTPYSWKNSDLDSWLEGAFGDNSEQPSSTSDGNKFAGLGNRGVKLNEGGRRIYQEVEVEKHVVYTLTIDSRSEVTGINSQVFILNNTAMASEDGLNTLDEETGLDLNGEENPDVDGYFLIDNDFNSGKSSVTNNTFTTNTFTFKPSTDKIIIYVRSNGAVDSDTEVYFDNIDIITPGF